MKTLYFDLSSPTQAEAYGAVISVYTQQGLTFELSRRGDWDSTAADCVVGVELTGGY